MNRIALAYNWPLAAVITIALVSSATGQIPDSTDVDQTFEFEQGDGWPVGNPRAGGWNPPYYDDDGQLDLQVEYLNWWLSGNTLPSLVTTSPVGMTPILGMPGTSVLFGDDDVDAGGRGGFRGTLGVNLAHWFDTDFKLEGDLIVIGGDGRDSGSFFASSSGDPILGRPFLNVQTGLQDAHSVAVPGLLFPDPVTGLPDPTLVLDNAGILIGSASDLNGAGVVARRTWTEGECHWIDLLAGYRYLRFQERLGILQFQSFSDPADLTRMSTIDILDSFSTWNEFHGGELGIVAFVGRGAVSLEMLAKVAIGNMHQILEISGATVVTRPEAPNVVVVEPSSGFLAAPSNVGRYTADRFNVVPEIGITLRRTIGRSVAVTVGYTLIAFPQALRTGDQIDTTIDPSQATAHPSAVLNESVVWMHGVDVGLEW